MWPWAQYNSTQKKCICKKITIQIRSTKYKGICCRSIPVLDHSSIQDSISSCLFNSRCRGDHLKQAPVHTPGLITSEKWSNAVSVVTKHCVIQRNGVEEELALFLRGTFQISATDRLWFCCCSSKKKKMSGSKTCRNRKPLWHGPL